MLFDSHVFLLAFLPCVLAAWWLAPARDARLALLLVASYVFYAWADVRYLPLLLATTGLHYACGRAIAAGHRRAMPVAIAGSLLLLGVFKYADFVLASLGDAAEALGLPGPGRLSVVLPVGISFYTLNAISYTLDVHRGHVDAERSLLRFATYVALFPHLVAGPILRYAEVRSALRVPPLRLDPRLAATGVSLLALGLFKKLGVADELAPHVDALFDRPGYGLFAAWAAALSYTLQLYFDFSGYADMAIGIALLLGIRFPQNFDHPLQARDISDFWRRWHMTLGRFMRDYVFIPLGGSRGSTAATVRNLLITFLIVGLWHGAAWTFVLWGAYHGALLGAHAVWRRRSGHRPRPLVGRVLTLGCVVAGFAVFRAADLAQAGQLVAGMAGLHGLDLAAGGPQIGRTLAAALAGLLVVTQLRPGTAARLTGSYPVLRPVAVGVAAAVSILLITQASPFLYFQF